MSNKSKVSTVNTDDDGVYLEQQISEVSKYLFGFEQYLDKISAIIINCNLNEDCKSKIAPIYNQMDGDIKELHNRLFNIKEIVKGVVDNNLFDKIIILNDLNDIIDTGMVVLEPNRKELERMLGEIL